MNLILEFKKIKKTGLVPTFIGGGLLAVLVPILNTAIRAENFIHIKETPINILLNANWQMMSMLNLLLIVSGTCIMYHVEFADKAMDKMRSLPINESSIWVNKFIVISALSLFVLFIEFMSIGFCSIHWFDANKEVFRDLIKNFFYSFLLILPSSLVSLLISSFCKNMWISLGIGIVGIFTATVLPMKNFIITLFPYALPFKTLCTIQPQQIMSYIIAVVVELIVIGVCQIIYLRIRGRFE